MATTNLELTVSMPASTPFYGDAPGGNTYTQNMDSNMQKIDDFAGTKGQANGLAPLGADGKVPSANLPDISAGVDIRRLV